MDVRKLLELSEYNGYKDICASINDKIYPIGTHYIEDAELFLFPTGEDSIVRFNYKRAEFKAGSKSWEVAQETRNNFNGDDMVSFITSEAQEECWYDWRNGSQFLDCPIYFTPESFNFLGFDSNNAHKVVSFKVTKDKVILICD